MFSYVVSYQGRPVLVHVASGSFLAHNGLVAGRAPYTRQLRAVDFPMSKHMTMLYLLLELCSVLMEAFGHVPQSEEAII